MKRYHVSLNGDISKARIGEFYPDGELFEDFNEAKMRSAELLIYKMRTNRQKISNLEMEIENAESGIDVIQSMDESDFTGYWSAF